MYALEGATVSLTGYGTATISVDGDAVFANVAPATDMAYEVTDSGFNTYNGTVTLINVDVTVDVAIVLTNYTVTFTVTDGTVAVEGASIAINGETLTTNASGIATIELVDADYLFEVTKDGYTTYSDMVTVSGEGVSVNVIMNGLNDVQTLLSIYPNPATDVLNIKA